MKALTTFILVTAALFGQALTQAERTRAIGHLQGTRKAFLDSVAGLSEAQWRFKPSPERWSIAECAEHIAISEDVVFDRITRILKSPPAPEKKAEVQGKDDLILKATVDRSRKFQAPEPVRPQGRWPAPESLIDHFRQGRDRTIRLVESTQEDLRSRFAPHPALGTLDAYQWLLFLSAHAERHIAQLNEVKADPGFPKH